MTVGTYIGVAQAFASAERANSKVEALRRILVAHYPPSYPGWHLPKDQPITTVFAAIQYVHSQKQLKDLRQSRKGKVQAVAATAGAAAGGALGGVLGAGVGAVPGVAVGGAVGGGLVSAANQAYRKGHALAKKLRGSLGVGRETAAQVLLGALNYVGGSDGEAAAKTIFVMCEGDAIRIINEADAEVAISLLAQRLKSV